MICQTVSLWIKNIINTCLQRMEFLSLSQKYLLYPVCIAFLFVQFSCMHIGIWPHIAYCVNINLQWHLDICLLLSLHFFSVVYKILSSVIKVEFPVFKCNRSNLYTHHQRIPVGRNKHKIYVLPSFYLWWKL